MRAGVSSSGAVVSCLGGDGGRTPPHLLIKKNFMKDFYFGFIKFRIFSCLIFCNSFKSRILYFLVSYINILISWPNMFNALILLRDDTLSQRLICRETYLK